MPRARAPLAPVVVVVVAGVAAALAPPLRGADSGAAPAVAPGVAPGVAPVVAPAVAPVAGPPRLGGAALQEAALARALFLVRRDVCLLVEGDAPSVASWDTDKTGSLVPMRTQVSRCDADAPLHALLHAGAASLALADAGKAPTAVAPPFDVDALDAAFRALFGRPLVIERAPTKLAGETLQSYDPVAMQLAFDALYVKPGETRLGIVMRRLYDATIKDELARQARDIALLTKNKKALAAEAKKLVDNARKGAEPHGKDAWRMALNRLVTSDEAAANIDPRLVGFVLRRQADGTLDTLLACLQRVLDDYAPAKTE